MEAVLINYTSSKKSYHFPHVLIDDSNRPKLIENVNLKQIIADLSFRSSKSPFNANSSVILNVLSKETVYHLFELGPSYFSGPKLGNFLPIFTS